MSQSPLGPTGDGPSATAAAARPASRAGRNLPMAIAVGLGLGVVIVATLLFFRPGFVVIIAAAVAASVWELRITLASRGITLAWVPVAVGSIATIVLAWPYGHAAQAAGIALTALACMAWRFRGGADGYLTDVGVSVFLAVYLGLFASAATLMVAAPDGSARVLTFLIVVVCSDTGGYASGVFFGKHPIAPTISPKKSWEGFAGSVAVAMTGGALSVGLLLHAPWWQGLLLGIVLAVTATGGDLAESLMKRDLGVKDMGTLLPGHGGIMDRLDSLLPSAVVCWMLLAVFVPVTG
ncbi:phosphatidate cytidylyltransferase [Nakamurella flavida]|uniref:Phosphatidate cytidylyltransferase n=1 Tax=Nakamurella flavida TaxID=363630 RepID=A0A938YEG0_9ACTN|nr:phosphatidate cytidylyltransferase [Nakamurella flavida]MBM9476165.1 phosphatidate cytidylyltransferase [Nakamurella flavida]MDP9777090.1 phosphatidate cytidylyltransferase [Nakamurella flavida]